MKTFKLNKLAHNLNLRAVRVLVLRTVGQFHEKAAYAKHTSPKITINNSSARMRHYF